MKIPHKASCLNPMSPIRERNREVQAGGGLLRTHLLFYAILTHVHNECIDKCEFFDIESVNLVNQDPVHLRSFCSPFSFPSYLLFSDSHLGHLSPIFLFLLMFRKLWKSS